MPLFGNIIVIKRNGTDGISFPLTASSCLFGRRTECDIRIQLPQVSKEHCKIEVNENKEAILTNLSTVNPTQLNGACFQQPVPLKHGDVLTIIDRSFRFEYPLQSTPRKRRSRTPKDETLQVLHVQQVAEVESLHKQTSRPKSLHASDNAEWEEKNANENKQSTEENISRALPIKLQTPKSAHRIHQSIKQNEMSPFSKLYEKLKREMKVKKSLQEGNVSQQAAKEDGRMVEPSAQISSSNCVYDLGSLTKEKEIDKSENIEECKIKVKQEVINSEFNQILAVGSATRKSFTRSPRTSVSKEVSRDIGKSHLQDHKELSTPGKSKGTEVTTTPSKEEDGNGNGYAAFLLKQCSIECLDYADKSKIYGSAIELDKLAQTTNTTNVLSTSTPKRKSPRSHFISPTKETSGVNPANTDAATTPKRVLLKRKSFSEIAAETQRQDSVCRNDSLKQLPLAENKCLKQRRNSKQHTTEEPVKEVVPKEICDRASFVTSTEGHSETPASLSNSKSPRRNNRQSKKLLNKSVHSETLASEELTSELASPASQKSDSGRRRGAPRTSGLQTEKSLETNAVQEHSDKTTDRKESGTKEELAAKGYHQKQDLEDASVMRPRRLSSKRRSSGSATVLKDNEAVSELNISGVLAEEESGKTKRVSQKRKSGDLLLQPLGKKKRVSFGGQLSPELFDKSLPPNSPLKKGATPARLSLPFGNSPRAVLKKAQGLKRFAVQELSEHLLKEKMSPKNSPARKSPGALSPASGKATPKLTLGSPAPYIKGRFSVSHITTPLPIAEEKDAVAEDVNTNEKNDARVRTPKSSHINEGGKTSLTATPDKLTRSAQLALKVTPMKRRSGAVAVINSKRRSGASSANLLVVKSWAEVVKLGVARPQSKPAKKSVRKGRSQKKITQSPKTPERKIKGHFSTGHAESPATIVVGRAYSTTVRTAGQVPKVVKNPILKLNMNMDESFTGMTEMFQTPENKSGKSLPLATVQKTDFTPTCTAAEISELHTPEESGEMMVSPLNSSDASEQKQDSPGICHLLRKESLNSVFDAIATKTPEKRKAIVEEGSSMDRLSIIPAKQACRVKSGSKRSTPKQKLEPAEVMSGIKQLLRTPEQRSEPVEALSGIKQLMKTPKRKPEPVEALSGIKQLMKTPKRKPEPVEALSGIKQLMKTPKRKPEPVEALSGIKQLMKTPKRKPEPVEALSGIKQLMKTPIEKREGVKDVAGVTLIKKTPKLKYQPVEDMIGISRIFKTPKEKVEPIEDVFGISGLVKTPREKYQPVDDFVGLQRLMAEPRQKCSDFEVDYVGVTEMFDTPEEMKVRSVSVMDSKQEDTAPPCTNSSHKFEDKGNISHGEDSQQKESTSEHQSTQRPKRLRPQKTVYSASAKQCEKDLNLKALQSLEKKSTQEEAGEISTSTSAAKNKGRGRRTNSCIQEEIVSKHPDQEKVETVSLVEPHGATQRPGRGKRKEAKEVKHPSENVESCGKDSSVLCKEPANMKQTLQKDGINGILETADDPTIKSVSVSSSTQNENCQLQTDVKTSENKSNDGGVEDREEMLLSPGKRFRGVKKVENTEPLIPPKRGRRARNDQVKQASSEDIHGTTRKLRKDPAAKMIQRDERTFDKDTETATAEVFENGTKLGIQITEKRVKSLRSARKHSTEVKADSCGMGLEKIQNIPKTEETSAETDAETHSYITNEIKVSRGDETENAQENTAEASQRLKAVSSSGETNKMPVTALNLEANRSTVQETNRTRNRRGKNDSLEEKHDEFAKVINSLELITPKNKSEAEMDESSLKDSLSSICVKNTYQVTKDQNDPAGTSIPAANSDSLARGRQKRTRNEQGILKPNQTEVLQENETQANQIACRRGRGRKVTFEPEEAGSKAVGGKRSFPRDDKDGQHETSENPSLQVRRSRRKQVDSMPQIACSTFMGKQTLIADHSKDEAFVKEQDSSLGATPSSTEDNPLRRGKRREVAAASQISRSLSIRTRRGFLEGDDKKMAVREDQNPALGNETLQAKANASARDKRKKIFFDLPVKENQLRKGRRKENAILLEPISSTSMQGKLVLSKGSGGRNNYGEAKKLILENCTSQEKMDLSKRSSRQTITSLAVSSTSLQGLPEDGNNETPEEKQGKLLDIAPSAKGNPSRVGRKTRISSKSEEPSSTFLREKPDLPKHRGQKRILKEGEDTSLENNSSQEETRQLRNKRKKIGFTSEAATAICKNGDLPENGNTSETQSACLTSTGSEKYNRSGKGKEVDPIQQATSTSRRRKCQLPADDLASKKLKSENGEDGSLQKGKRSKTKEQLGKEAVRATRTAEGTDRRTRSSTRTSTRTRK